MKQPTSRNEALRDQMLTKNRYSLYPATRSKEKNVVPMHRLLLDVFQALNKAQIRYCLLRGFDELATSAANQEIDLLVDSKHLTLLERTVARYGFVTLPSWGQGPHHFFVAYDKENGTWLKLDVVTDLVYGKPVRFLHIDLADDCLSKRYLHGPTYVLSLEDEFITLLLHCLLDKGRFRTEHRTRLKSLLDEASGGHAMKRRISAYAERYLPPSITWNTLVEAIDGQDWDSLIVHRKAMARKLFWQKPIMSSWRKISALMLRRLRPLLFFLRQHGISVALLAPDGAGKSTLASNLTREDYLRARLIYMGGNIDSSNIVLPATRWLMERSRALNGQRQSPKRIVVKGLNFSNRLAEQWYRYSIAWFHKMSGRFVIFDRYLYDLYVAPPGRTFGKRLGRWLRLRTCPSPDLVILLDAPGEVLYARKHEHSPEWLEGRRQTFLALKDKIPNMIIVDATQSAEAVYREVISIIWQYYGDRVREKELNGRDRG